MRSLFRSRATIVVAGAAVVLGLGGTTAVAAGLIDSSDIKDNSIYSADIHDGSVANDDLGWNSVTGGKVANGAISLVDLATEVQTQLDQAAKSAYNLAVEGGFSGSQAEWLASLNGDPGEDGVDGGQGPAGPAGADGQQGPAGPAGADGTDGSDGVDGVDGVSGYEVIGRGADASAENGRVTMVTGCAEGEQVMSGGVKSSVPAEVTIHSSFPSNIVRVGPNTDEDPSGLWAATSWTTVYTNTGTGNVQPYIVCMDIAELDN